MPPPSGPAGPTPPDPDVSTSPGLESGPIHAVVEPPPGHLRPLLVGLLRTFLFAVLSIVLWWLCAWLLDSLPWIHSELALTTFSLLPAASAATAFLLAFADMRPVSAVALPMNRLGLRHLLFGFLIGVSLSVAIVGGLWMADWVEIQYGTVEGSLSEVLWAPSLGVGFVVLACGAIGEELLFRGYGLQQLMLATHPWAAMIASSILFGVVHASNPDFSNVALVNTALFGLLFGLALLRHRTLWISSGLHFGWNFSLACMGANLSGLTIRLTGMEIVPIGPAPWSGAEYGPEGSLLTTLAVIVVGALLWRLPLRSNPEPVLWDRGR